MPRRWGGSGRPESRARGPSDQPPSTTSTPAPAPKIGRGNEGGLLCLVRAAVPPPAPPFEPARSAAGIARPPHARARDGPHRVRRLFPRGGEAIGERPKGAIERRRASAAQPPAAADPDSTSPTTAVVLDRVAHGSHIWLEDKHLAWIDGEVFRIEGQNAHVHATNGKTVIVSISDIHPKDTEVPFNGIDDMTRLSYLHEPGVLNNLAIRYAKNIIYSNPVLEAFGNAKTVRNNNSRYKLADPSSFHYLNQSTCIKLDEISDAKEYLATRSAMNTVGISEEEQEATFRVVAAVLHLGNISFVKGREVDSSLLKDEKARFHLKAAAELLMCDCGNLENALIKRKINTPEGVITTTVDPNSATVSRDGLAKQIYSQLFDWLVNRLNASIGQDTSSDRLIGVLDIYGFESFKTNSFEQLCINFTNEKLQQHFNQNVFKMEQEEYNREQIDWSYIEFVDNQDVLDLIEKKPGGIIALLDEAW
nr:unnamed protein product [Digitaria exilis]